MRRWKSRPGRSAKGVWTERNILQARKKLTEERTRIGEWRGVEGENQQRVRPHPSRCLARAGKRGVFNLPMSDGGANREGGRKETGCLTLGIKERAPTALTLGAFSHT